MPSSLIFSILVTPSWKPLKSPISSTYNALGAYNANSHAILLPHSSLTKWEPNVLYASKQSPFFKKYRVWLKYDKQLIGFNGNNITDFHKEYKQWRKENELILNKASNDKKIVIIGAVMGSMILLTILYCLLKSFRTSNSRNSSRFIEEV